MLGQIANNTASTSRYFRYEVVGLRQNEETDKTDYQLRSSASTFVTVPYNRMNAEMQRITRMGGKIVGIEPLHAGATSGNNEGNPFTNEFE
ncbi:phycobilisome linker polypeptide [Calothrix sp. UHCC 0171]|uniref:phycobilisome linker polypeptide n=1 Tax=Calothrix sp. UHCC 0171 TaxID=3110245 RepID=UPI002B21703C|nr:phycobilisome linker polypeptide [Calothrix sp. UHCC 0171]MEA5570446.1 phycobilisome linker polypeptide [Calothrix sp. UHCC 0171]